VITDPGWVRGLPVPEQNQRPDVPRRRLRRSCGGGGHGPIQPCRRRLCPGRAAREYAEGRALERLPDAIIDRRVRAGVSRSRAQALAHRP